MYIYVYVYIYIQILQVTYTYIYIYLVYMELRSQVLGGPQHWSREMYKNLHSQGTILTNINLDSLDEEPTKIQDTAMLKQVVTGMLHPPATIRNYI